MKIIAKAVRGQEFFYSARSAHRITAGSVNKILKILNELNWTLKDGEIWHSYDVDEYDTAYDFAKYQTFSLRKGRLTARSC